MPHLKTWRELPPGIREHLIERMRDRSLRVTDLNKLQIWVESRPIVPEWFKDFGSFKLCGEGPYPKTFLLPGQAARGVKL